MWESVDDEERRYRFQSEAHAAVKEVVAEIVFDAVSDTIILAVANGVRLYCLQSGQLSKTFDGFGTSDREGGEVR